MPWWSWLWVVVLIVGTIGGARIDFEKGKLAMGLLGLASGASSVLGVLTFFRVPPAPHVTPFVAPLCVAGGVWLVIESVEGFRDVWTNTDPKLLQSGVSRRG